ncbi:glycosyltransferase [Candidatus Woesearchaeota archaeon]|nr:glycosyltransferase [Candidatus Woesearchaeota archaeon]
MKLSTVSSVYNEDENVKRAIQNLASQEIVPDEAVIVNDGSTDRTKEIIDKLKQKYKWLKVIHKEKNTGRQVWFEGYKIAKGPIITVFDIDTIPPKNWIKEIKSKFTKDVGLVGGLYVPAKSENLLENLQEIFIQLIIKVKNTWIYRLYRKKIDKNLLMAGTNTSFRKDFAEKLNILPRRLPYANDRRIQEGFRKSDYKIRFLKSIVKSRVPSSFKKFTSRWFRWGKAEPARIGLKLNKLILKLTQIAVIPILLALAFIPATALYFWMIALILLMSGGIVFYFVLGGRYDLFLIALSLILMAYAKIIHSLGYIHYFKTRK